MHTHATWDHGIQIVLSILPNFDAIRFTKDNNELELLDDRDLVSRWKKSKGETTTARSWLLELYVEVSHIYWSRTDF